ncbi:potassium-transporting ATPase subunit F [Pseudoroseicyclus aestuarii]|uniref:potassium-transporting ATPase subunit F n=1 Tax=Pseudoroseicyclus aestuarii TaxID=1795041 RepID=UPI003CCC81A4
MARRMTPLSLRGPYAASPDSAWRPYGGGAHISRIHQTGACDDRPSVSPLGPAVVRGLRGRRAGHGPPVGAPPMLDIVLGLAVAAGLLVYLLAVLLRPQDF